MKKKVEKVVPYFRVSTKTQSTNGQRPAVAAYLKSIGPHEVLGEFEEIESGKSNQRPELTKALNLCKENDALLLVAKLDRLSRNVAFIATLQDSGVRFKACDIPEADKFTIHIFAALAQKERELISQRTKEGLAEIKARGKKLGTANEKVKKLWEERGRENSLKTRREQTSRFLEGIRSKLENELQLGKSQQAIADTFNSYGLKAQRGGLWSQKGVGVAIKKLKLLQVGNRNFWPSHRRFKGL